MPGGECAWPLLSVACDGHGEPPRLSQPASGSLREQSPDHYSNVANPARQVNDPFVNQRLAPTIGSQKPSVLDLNGVYMEPRIDRNDRILQRPKKISTEETPVWLGLTCRNLPRLFHRMRRIW